MYTALELGTPDLVPNAPWQEALVCNYLGINLRDILIEGDALAHGQYAAYRKFGYDWISIGLGLAAIAPEALGAKVSYPGDNFPGIEKPSVIEVGDADKILPPDPEKDGRFPQYFKGISKLSGMLDEEAPICMACFSPFAIACRIRGVNQILLDVYEHPELVHKLMDICAETQLRVGLEGLRAGVKMVYFGADMECPLILSPDHYDEFARDKNKRLIEELTRAGLKVIFHMCGDIIKTGLIDRIVDTASVAVSPGNVTQDKVLDLDPLKEKYGDKICIFANLNPTGVLLGGTPDRVKEEVRELMDKGKKGGGFIFHTAGTMSPLTPRNNFDAMMATVNELGIYE